MKRIPTQTIIFNKPTLNEYPFRNSSMININQDYLKPQNSSFLRQIKIIKPLTTFNSYYAESNINFSKSSSIVKKFQANNLYKKVENNDRYNIIPKTRNINTSFYNKIFQNRNSGPLINTSFFNNPNNRNFNISQSQSNIFGDKNLSAIQGNYIKNSIILSYNNNLNEPGEKLNLMEFELSKEIGKGTYGKIYSVKWKLNNKFYALKREKLNNIAGVKKRQNTFKIIKEFVKKTNSKGLVNIYSNLYLQKEKDFYYYELMEMCDRDFEQEIKFRGSYYLFYTENEFRNIICQLITTLASLQKNHITHRDIKPQNILVVNGQYKLCDFGEIRVMQREGIVVQRVRGSELYMSPILFYGLRNKLIQVRHNTYKSDVFSLGMCLFFAAGLSYRGPVEIREVSDMKQKAIILNKHLGGRYSQKLIKILHLMLQTEESNRPDFILLEEAIKIYGL
jgi:hypothetical protein